MCSRSLPPYGTEPRAVHSRDNAGKWPRKRTGGGEVMGMQSLSRGCSATIPAMVAAKPGAITLLLKAWSDGDARAQDRLWPLVYDELRQMAAHYLERERRSHTLQPTALVHEAYIKTKTCQVHTFGDSQDREGPSSPGPAAVACD